MGAVTCLDTALMDQPLWKRKEAQEKKSEKCGADKAWLESTNRIAGQKKDCSERPYVLRLPVQKTEECRIVRQLQMIISRQAPLVAPMLVPLVATVLVHVGTGIQDSLEELSLSA